MSRRKVRREDAAICVLGVVCSLTISSSWAAHPRLPVVEAVAFLVAVAVLSRMPAELPGRSGPIEITFAPAALVVLALQTSPGLACALWFVATVALRLTERQKPMTDRVFNVGCVALSGDASILVLSRHGSALHVSTVGLVALACVVYFALDMALVTWTLALIHHQRSGAFTIRGLMPALIAFVGANSLGYLVVVLDTFAPRWTLCLLLGPLAAIFAATRSLKRARESERRMAAVYAVSRAAASMGSLADVTACFLEEIRLLLPGRDVQLREQPPADDEIGAALTSLRGHGSWIIISPGLGYTFSAAERSGLDDLMRLSVEMLDRHRLLDELTRTATTDALTGFANRTAFFDKLHQTAARLPEGSTTSAAVLYCDIDGFKGVNDRLGHATGDRALAATADRLSSCLRTEDTAARLGGDEFAILIDRVTEATATELAQRIVAAFDEPLELGDGQLPLRISVGLAMVTHGDSPVKIVQEADAAMYAAKAAGRGQARTFDPADRHTIAHNLLLEADLRTAFNDKSLWLAWQPIVELDTGRLDGFEVLIRWTHPTFGDIPPDRMLPIAIRLGLMPALGRWILDQAVLHGLTLSEHAGRPLAIAVNVAPEQLHDDRFIALAQHHAADRRLRLVLELTEHTLIDGDQASPILDLLHEAGAAISLDDFGSGYSSMDYLHRFHSIDAIKIDRSFICALTNPRTKIIVESVAAMASAFEAIVVAEGIEDWKTATTANNLGCRLGQGYLFGRPCTIDAAITIAERGYIDGPWPVRREAHVVA
jgi:diguanylate cyclase (GGDEF)-like protein